MMRVMRIFLKVGFTGLCMFSLAGTATLVLFSCLSKDLATILSFLIFFWASGSPSAWEEVWTVAEKQVG